VIPTLGIQLLGDFLLASGDTPVTTVNVPRLQSLLAYLLLRRTAPQDRSHLAFLLWPDSTEAQAHTNLRKLLHQLRQALPDADHFIYTDKHNLQWRSAPGASWTLDVQDFEQALAQAEQAEQAQDTAVLRQTLEQASHLYCGDLLPSCYDEWILPERDRLHQLFLQSAERLIALLDQERDYTAAIAVAQRLLRHDPLHEATYRQLMHFYALRGDRAAALRVYHTCVTVLERELAAEPGEATRQAYESLLQSDTSPRPTTGPLAPRGGGAPLVGRKQEWRDLQAVWRKAASGIPVPPTGYPRMIVLSGEAGIGKTKLAEELLAWVSRQGMTTASARCYAAQGGLAYAPVTAWLHADVIQTRLSGLDKVWLTEVARLLPDLLTRRPGLPRPNPMTEGWQRQHFFEALARALLDAPQPLLLLLDDLQWCNSETLEWLHYLLHFETRTHLLLVGTVRSEEAPPGHPLVAFLGALQRDGLVMEIALGPLTSSETTSLAGHILGHQLDPAMTGVLHRETEGNPLFVVEMLRAGTLEPRAAGPGTSDTPYPLLTQPASTLPPTVQSVLAARLAQLSPLAREVANVAAVIGREFTFVVLAQAGAEREDAVVRGLDELWQRRIVREQGAGTAETYDFSHDKLREQAYASLSPAHRRLLHRRVAEAFEAVYADALGKGQGNLDAVSGQIAVHYERAGLPGLAVSYYRRAGEVAMRVYAHAEAIATFQQAAVLLEASPPGHVLQERQWQEAALLYEDMGEVFGMTGQLQEARQAYQHAMTYVPAQEYVWQARLQRKQAATWLEAPAESQGPPHVNALQGYQAAERILEQAPVKSSTEWLQEWIQLQLNRLLPIRATVDEMTAVIEKAQPIVEQHGTPEQRVQFLLAVVARDAARDRYVITEKTVSYCRAALAPALQAGNKDQVGFPHFALGLCLLWSGHLDEAEEHLSAALSVGEQTGNVALLARSLTFLPFVFRLRGQVEEVRGIITRVLAVPAARKNSIITGHRAWVAWRDGAMAEAEAYGRASLEGRQDVSMFHWAGLWPLIGVALTQEKIAEAIHYVRMLLDPTQQPPPEQLQVRLVAALHAWDAGQWDEARALLQQIMPLAEQMGYL
jgi:DNA-binding SARP family transcriptional activator